MEILLPRGKRNLGGGGIRAEGLGIRAEGLGLRVEGLGLMGDGGGFRALLPTLSSLLLNSLFCTPINCPSTSK